MDDRTTDHDEFEKDELLHLFYAIADADEQPDWVRFGELMAKYKPRHMWDTLNLDKDDWGYLVWGMFDRLRELETVYQRAVNTVNRE